MTNKTFDLIVAAGKNGEIGYKGCIPWPRLRLDRNIARCAGENIIVVCVCACVCVCVCVCVFPAEQI